MTPGKAAAQAGHAFLDAYLTAPPEIQSQYREDRHGTKIVLGCRDAEALHRIYNEAFRLGFPCALVIERDHIMPPDFDGSPIVTAVGIGPIYREKARFLTKKLHLFQGSSVARALASSNAVREVGGSNPSPGASSASVAQMKSA